MWTTLLCQGVHHSRNLVFCHRYISVESGAGYPAVVVVLRQGGVTGGRVRGA